MTTEKTKQLNRRTMGTMSPLDPNARSSGKSEGVKEAHCDNIFVMNKEQVHSVAMRFRRGVIGSNGKGGRAQVPTSAPGRDGNSKAAERKLWCRE
eukprot:222251-Pyramimonas_sp.AAC.1